MSNKTSHTQMEQTKVYIICKNRSERLSEIKEMSIQPRTTQGGYGGKTSTATYDCC